MLGLERLKFPVNGRVSRPCAQGQFRAIGLWLPPPLQTVMVPSADSISKSSVQFVESPGRAKALSSSAQLLHE